MTLPTLLPEVEGPVLLGGDDGYAAAAQPWNLAIHLAPAAVVEAASVADVQAVVRHARAQGLRVAPQSTGHGAEQLTGDLSDAILLRTGRLDHLAVDADRRVARIGAGVKAGALAAAAAAHGLAAPLGVAEGVGVTGLALGGGVGWLSRAHGLAANAIVSLDVVTADGEARHVDADHDPELFYALRGGGGRYALVTGLEIELYAIDEVSGGMIAWPAEAYGEVLEQVRRIGLDAPECLSLITRVLSLPPLDAIPEPIRGRRIVAVAAVYVGPAHDAERHLAPLRSAGGTLLDTFGPIGIADLVKVAGDPVDPGPSRGEGILIGELTPDVVAEMAAIADDPALSALTVIEVRQLGGALRRAPEGHGALDRLDGSWQVFAAGFAPEPAAAEAVLAALGVVRERLAPYASDRVLLNARGAGIDVADAFDADTSARLQRTYDAYDPDRLILAGHVA
jgi:FAD/FMN-containing dehydrogenase